MVGSGVYHPTLVTIDGSYDDVNRVCTELSYQRPWAFVNINVRPYYAEGSKTLAFETAEQLEWRAPDRVVAPMASGSLFTKIWKGFQELEKIGLIQNPKTKMNGAQAQGCSPIATAYEAGSMNFVPQKPDTIARSLAIGNPADGYYALKTMEQTGGGAAMASDMEIIEAIQLLAETEGVFAETAGGVTIACLKKLVKQGIINKNVETVAYITGAGLKTVEAVSSEIRTPIHIQPKVEEFDAALEAYN